MAYRELPTAEEMAPVFHALEGSPLRPVVVHTGQHGEVAWDLYRFFNISPNYCATVGFSPISVHFFRTNINTYFKFDVNS